MHIRDAVRDDAYDLARLQALAADGIVEFCYEGAGVDAIELLGRIFAAEDEPYSYRKCIVAEDAGCVVGKLHSYGWDDTATLMPADPYIPSERAAAIEALAPPTPVSWHVEVVAVLPEYQGRGLGQRFIALAKAQARKNGFDTLSLHVFEANEGAIRLYRRCGFTAVDRVPIPDGIPLPHLGGNILMVCELGLNED